MKTVRSFSQSILSVLYALRAHPRLLQAYVRLLDNKMTEVIRYPLGTCACVCMTASFI